VQRDQEPRTLNTAGVGETGVKIGETSTHYGCAVSFLKKMYLSGIFFEIKL